VPIARGLAPGKHTLTIIVTGKKNAASSNCYVQIVGADVEAAPRPPIPSVKALADQVSCSVDYFDVAGHSAFLIRPKGKTNSTPMPWVWYAPVIGHPNPTHAWMLRQWLDKGIAMAGVDVGESFGSPAGRKVFSALWETLTSRYGMSKQPCLLPQSRGGLMLYNWAASPASIQCATCGAIPGWTRLAAPTG
jgi:hypothetical protein